MKIRTFFDGKQNQTDGKACACSAFSSPEEFSFFFVVCCIAVCMISNERVHRVVRERKARKAVLFSHLCACCLCACILPPPTALPYTSLSHRRTFRQNIYNRIVFAKQFSLLCTLAFFHWHS